MSTCALIVAAGRSERFGGATPKLLVPWRGRPLLVWTLTAFQDCPAVEHVILVTTDEVEGALAVGSAPFGRKVRAVVRGGATRQDSVAAGVAALPEDAAILLVHDGARPHVSPELIERVAAAARRSGAAVPVVAETDTVKRVERRDGRERVLETLDRRPLRRAQTPQGFRLEVFLAASAFARERGLVTTDDVALVEAAAAAGALPAGATVEAVAGEVRNVKITTAEDLEPGGGATRIGLGRDVHPLEAGRAFVLAGVDVQAGLPEARRIGPVGHSDGDALTHAVCDALLAAAGLPDIGRLFPDSDPAHAGRASLAFLDEVVDRLAGLGLRPAHVSAVIGLERPRLAGHLDAVRAALAAHLALPLDRVSVVAKRGEGLGPVGEGRAMTCDAVAAVEGGP